MSDLETIADVGGLDDGSEIQVMAIWIVSLLERVRNLEERMSEISGMEE